jgi:hypothetical protein
MKTVTELLESLEMSLRSDGEPGAQSPYEIGWELAATIRHESQKRHPQEAQEWFQKTSEHISRLYKDGDERARRCIIDGLLEHVLEIPMGDALFHSWCSDASLAAALAEAREWASAINKIRSSLEKVAQRCMALLERTESPASSIRSHTQGTDVVVLGFNGLNATNAMTELVIEPADDLARFLYSGGRLSRPDIELLARFSINPDNWKESDHLPGEFWVTLPSPESNVVRHADAPEGI